jgi:hypothetical protein
MSFTELENFYSQFIDIYVNLSSKHAFNGWPLGLEAVKNGCALLTTDPDHVAHFYNADEYGIKPMKFTLQFVLAIRRYEKNQDLLLEARTQNVRFVEKYSSFGAQQGKIFRFLEKLILELSKSDR